MDVWFAAVILCCAAASRVAGDCNTYPLSIIVSRNNTTDNLTSPNYPDNYPQNSDIKGCIMTHKYEGIIRVHIIHLDILKESEGCEKDSLIIYEDYGRRRHNLATLCGRQPTVDYLELCCQMEVVFKSDNQTSGTGFLIEYSITYGMDDIDNRDGKHSSQWGVVVVVIFALIAAVLVTTLACAYIYHGRKSKEEPKPFDSITN